MDVSTAFDVSVSEYPNSQHDLKQSFANCKQCCCSNSNFIEDGAVAELGFALCGSLHIQDIQALESGCIPHSDGSHIFHPDKGKMHEELTIHELKSSSITTQKSLTKCATYPGSKRTPSCSLSVDVREEIADTAFQVQRSMKYENPVCTRSISLPTPLKLVSAMKGSREKHGTPLKKLTVKWAPDVYDPPATSLSHTVKSHNQLRYRTHKKNVKQKHKGKSSRGSNHDKKHYRRYIGNTGLCPKSPSSNYNGLLFSRSNQSLVEQMDFPVTDQDSKCGGGFLQTSLAKVVHISVAEAT